MSELLSTFSESDSPSSPVGQSHGEPDEQGRLVLMLDLVVTTGLCTRSTLTTVWRVIELE